MTESRREFFDRIADQWDGWVDLERMGQHLREGLVEFGVSPSASVVDLGCGTGNLVLALVGHLGGQGRVTAVDFSERMIEQARSKVSDDRIRWVCSDAASLPLEDHSVDVVLCFSAWPHFPEPDMVLIEVRRVLRPGGVLIIWHDISRHAVNAIHAEVSPAVSTDLLEPATQLGRRLQSSGFALERQVDDDRRYLTVAMMPEG